MGKSMRTNIFSLKVSTTHNIGRLKYCGYMMLYTLFYWLLISSLLFYNLFESTELPIIVFCLITITYQYYCSRAIAFRIKDIFPKILFRDLILISFLIPLSLTVLVLIGIIKNDILFGNTVYQLWYILPILPFGIYLLFYPGEEQGKEDVQDGGEKLAQHILIMATIVIALFMMLYLYRL